MFVRGRIDHIALNVDDEDTLHRCRRRLLEAGAGDGATTDFGIALSVWFRDPDGLECEVVWNRPSASWTDCLDVDAAVRTTAEAWDAALLAT
jgi:catechol-2,3-dioxygenase